MACDEGGRRLSANDRLGFISPRVTSCSRLTAGGGSGPEARHVQIGRAVTIHIAMASSSFQWTLSLKKEQIDMQTMTRHARTGNRPGNGNSVHFAACALSKISANPKLWTRIGRWPVSRLSRPSCKVKPAFPTCSTCHAYANIVPSIIFLATALRAFNRRSSTN